MRILFLGGTGNLTTDCTRILHEQGHEISVVTRGNHPVPPEYRALRADRRNSDELREAVRGANPEVVLNFIGFDVEDVAIDHAVFAGSVRQYLFISSATVYQRRPDARPITEDAPLGNPWWDYARKKIACEEWLCDHHDPVRFPVTIIRPSHTYSRFWVPNPVSSASFTYARRIQQGLPVFVPDDGENPWTLTAARDFAIGVAGLVGNPRAIGETFHITSDEVLTWNRITAEIATALGVTNPRILRAPTDLICEVAPRLVGNLRGDKAYPGVFDNAKIKRVVPSFRCQVAFREGVRESVDWLLAHPEFQNLNPEIDAICDAVAARG